MILKQVVFAAQNLHREPVVVFHGCLSNIKILAHWNPLAGAAIIIILTFAIFYSNINFSNGVQRASIITADPPSFELILHSLTAEVYKINSR